MEYPTEQTYYCIENMSCWWEDNEKRDNENSSRETKTTTNKQTEKYLFLYLLIYNGLYRDYMQKSGKATAGSYKNKLDSISEI